MVKIYHATPWLDYSNWIKDSKPVDNPKEADLILFCGGTDVFAGRYGEVAHPRAETPDHKRDEKEIALFKEAVALGKPMLGICRGSQLLCVMNHGRLVQDQPNPKSRHMITTIEGGEILITSSHHQAQYPFNLTKDVDYKVLAWTDNELPHHQDGTEEEMNPNVECEVVYYPKTRALAIQGHPEWMSRPDHKETFEWLDEKIDNLLNNKL